MNLRAKLVRAACAIGTAALLVPAGAVAHDGQDRGDFRFGGHHRHHHRSVLLKGTVQSVNASDSTLVVKVTKAGRKGQAFLGEDVTVKAVKGWVADTNNDGKRSIADVKVGDTVVVLTKRRYVDTDTNKVAAAFVWDKTNSPARFSRDGSYDGDRDGRCDGDR